MPPTATCCLSRFGRTAIVVTGHSGVGIGVFLNVGVSLAAALDIHPDQPLRVVAVLKILAEVAEARLGAIERRAAE